MLLSCVAVPQRALCVCACACACACVRACVRACGVVSDVVCLSWASLVLNVLYGR